eukprot:10429531-Alexandrium_andersonii.AAC.1
MCMGSALFRCVSVRGSCGPAYPSSLVSPAMSDIGDLAGLMSQSPTGGAPSVGGDSERSAK